MMRIPWVLWAAAAVVLQAQAQDLRDPTLPPSIAGVAPDAPDRAPAGVESGMSVIVRDGKPGLVVGTRVVYPGQKVGASTLDRITETEIWLRDGATLRKVSRFGGIQRRDPALVPVCPDPAATTPSKARSGKTAKHAPASPASTKADPLCDAPPTRSATP